MATNEPTVAQPGPAMTCGIDQQLPSALYIRNHILAVHEAQTRCKALGHKHPLCADCYAELKAENAYAEVR